MEEAKIPENMLEGYEIIHGAIMAGLHGFDIQVSIKTRANMPGAFVAITYPDRKSGTQAFNFVFDENGVFKDGLPKNRICEFLAKMKQIIKEDDVIKQENEREEEMDRQFEEWNKR